ncbi:MAG: RNA methyltransferase [Bacteroidales bacterium]|nr:RNA methyltransferase [Bacteroidales bacterium]
MRKLSIEELQRIDVESFKKAEKIPVIIILDNIRSQHNVGSIFRTGDAFRVSELLLCGITAKPPSREIEKTALGATQSVIWKYFENTIDAIVYCKEKNYKLVAVEQTNISIDIRSIVYNETESIAFVFGNEIHGVSQVVLDNCDLSIEIPQFGTKHSFNVSVTSGIVLYDYFLKMSKRI